MRARRIKRLAITGRAKRAITSAVKSVVSTIKALVVAFFDPLVVVTMMTTLALIIAVLAYFAPTTPPPRWVVILCYVIGFFGLATIALQVRSILKKKAIREELGDLLEQGHYLRRVLDNDAEPLPVEAIDAWAISVEKFLDKNFGRAYVFRFRSRGGFHGVVMVGGEARRNDVYMFMLARLENLEKFAGELGIG